MPELYIDPQVKKIDAYIFKLRPFLSILTTSRLSGVRCSDAQIYCLGIYRLLATINTGINVNPLEIFRNKFVSCVQRQGYFCFETQVSCSKSFVTRYDLCGPGDS